MAPKIGRNAPCPCGSGAKYKKCCLSQIEAARAAAPGLPIVLWEDDDLDDLSNSVLDHLRDGDLDAAERACDELDRRYPDMIDGIERRAKLLEARGDNKRAAAYYRRAADFARTHDDFDRETIDEYLDVADRLDPPSGSAAP